MLVEKLKKDMIEAMKNKDKEKLTVIRMVKAALDKERIDKKADLIKQTEEELEILKDYLPEQLSEEEVITIIEEVINEVNAETIKDMGKVMKEVTPKVKGKADMKHVSEIIKSKLN